MAIQLESCGGCKACPLNPPPGSLHGRRGPSAEFNDYTGEQLAAAATAAAANGEPRTTGEQFCRPDGKSILDEGTRQSGVSVHRTVRPQKATERPQQDDEKREIMGVRKTDGDREIEKMLSREGNRRSQPQELRGDTGSRHDGGDRHDDDINVRRHDGGVYEDDDVRTQRRRGDRYDDDDELLPLKTSSAKKNDSFLLKAVS